MQTDYYESLREAAKNILSTVKEKEKSSASSLILAVKKAKKIIDATLNQALAMRKSKKPIPNDFMWIYDNSYLYDEAARKLIKDLKKQKDLPCAMSDGKMLMPLYFIGFYRYISETSCEINTESVSAFVSAIEKPLSYSDFYSFGVLFMSSAVIRIAQICTNLSEDSDKAASDIGKMTASIRFLSDYSIDSLLENCQTEKILRLDPSGDYCNMTDATKNYYRSRLVALADKKGVTEQAFAKEIIEKARQVEKGKEKHIGFYLYPSKSKIKRFLYFTVLFLLVTVTTLFITLFHPVCIVAFFPIYELAKQMTDKAFSYFTPIVPLPCLEIKKLPDTDGVLTVITTMLDRHSVNELFIRLENLYHSCGMKNVYFAILADFSESTNPSDPGDDELFSDAHDRICALNMKYKDCFFLFVRKRTYNEKEHKFMGYERKRGAIDGLCKFLSAKGDSGFIKCQSMPDRSICSKIRYILTLDSDTNLPPDAVKKFAGIMLHPLNAPNIDEKNGIVKDGYALIQSSVDTDLASASRTPFSKIFSGSGGFEIYSFSGFELYQNVFGEGTFCGKGMFDRYAYMKCIGNDSFAFPENRILSHDILEGARLRAANATNLRVTDGFPSSTVSYLKRYHRWVRGDTQNLIFLRKYIRNSQGKLIKNSISTLSKYKLFDNFRRSAVPFFAYAGVIISAFLKPIESAVLLLFSLFYILYGFISDFASKASGVGISCTARKYFSKNAIPGIILSFYRVLLEVSMLPSTAVCSISAICVSLYRMFISKRKMLEWTTASMSDSAVQDSLLYYIRKNMFCALSGTVLYTFSHYSYLKLIGFMWFLFPITAYFIGKAKNDENNPPATDEKNTIAGYAKDMWSYFEDAVSEKSCFLPIDNIQLFPKEIRSSKTSPTNIGLYLTSVLAARDFSFIDTEQMYKLLKRTLDTVEKLQKWNGHLYNWYNTENLSVINPTVISSVDSGNFLACLICLKEGLKEYVNEKTELLDIISEIENIIDSTKTEKLFDKNRNLFYIEAEIDKNSTPHFSQGHFDMLMSEARTLSYIAVAKKTADVKHYARLSRPIIKHTHRIGVASWTGTAFEYFMPALFMPVVKGSLMYEALRFALYRQKANFEKTNSGKVFGISESGYFAFDDEMNYQYKAFGIQELALKTGLYNDSVISPYSSFLMMCLDMKTSLENLKKLKKENLYGKYGFYEACDFTASRCLDPKRVISFMSHHTGMSILSCANALYENIFVKRFMQDPAMRSISELLEERIPVDCAVKKIASHKKH